MIEYSPDSLKKMLKHSTLALMGSHVADANFNIVVINS